MAVSSKTQACILAALVGLCIAARTVVAAGRIDDNLMEDWGNMSVSADGQVISLYLDQTSGSGFRSKDTYMYARADIQIKLVPNESAGTVATFFFTSDGPNHDEIDLEFLGNVSGQPYTLHTNIFANGTGQKEQQFRLPFDDTTTEMSGFHTYSIVWTDKSIIFLVDGTPIREFRNYEKKGVAYPSTQRMRLKGSLWNADGWATQGGRVKTDWSKAPFVAQYRNFAVTAPSGGYGQEMDGTARKKMNELRDKYMIYNYCTDPKSFINGTAPTQCSIRPGTG